MKININISELYKNKDSLLSASLSFLILSYMLEIMMTGIVSRIAGDSVASYVGYVIIVIWYFLIIINIPSILTVNPIKWIIPYFMFFSVCISFYFVDSSIDFFYHSKLLFLYCIPAYLMMGSIQNYNKFNTVMKFTSYALFILCTMYFLLFSMQNTNRAIGYDMVFGYQITFSILLLLDSYSKKPKKTNLLFVILGMLMLLIKGSRGPISVILLYFILKLVFKKTNNGFRKILSLISLSIFGILILNSYTWLLTYVNGLLNQFGIYSRNIEFILNGEITKDNGRDGIYNFILEKIKSNPYGNGVFSDRLYLENGYVHNIILELIYNYGVIIGSMLILLIIVGIIIKFSFNDENQYFFAYVSYGIGSLIFSGSYLTSFYFFILLAMIFSISKIDSRNKKHFGFYELKN